MSISSEDVRKMPLNELNKKRKEILSILQDDQKVTMLESVSSKILISNLKEMEKVIYGEDNRREIMDVRDEKIQENASGVVALIRVNDVVDNGNNTSTINTRIYGVSRNLCADEPFYAQPIAPFCSGFLVSKDIVATAAHCVDDLNDLKAIKFIFGFRMRGTTHAQTVIDNSEIYTGKTIIKRVYTDDGPD